MRPLLFLALTLSVQAAPPLAVTIKTLQAQMKFDTPEIIAVPGQELKLTLENNDDLPHNLVICKPGTDTLAMSNNQMTDPEAVKRNWLPKDPAVLAHTKMLNPHEKDTLTFKLPGQPAIFPFVCTFPGHALVMRGTIKSLPEGPGLSDLTFKLYLGDWKKLPDFKSLVPHREGPVPDNLVQIKLDDYKNHFGIVYEGRLHTPRKALYKFYLTSDDGARLFINDKQVVEYDGIHPAGDIKKGVMTLPEGDHAFRLEYFQAAGNIELFAAWESDAFQMTALSKWKPDGWRDGKPKRRQDESTGMPLAVTNEPVIYRNFIQGAGNRGIGVGYPGSVNLAWSAESMNLALIWRGAFIDAARHWNGRGGGAQPPLGYDVLKPTGDVTPAWFITDKPDAEWPQWDKDKRYDDFLWKGYRLDKRGSPTFRYLWKGVSVEESFKAEGNGLTPGGNAKLVRTIHVSGTVPANAWYRIAAANHIENKDGVFACDEGSSHCRITVSGAQIAGRNLVVAPKPGTITVTYQWAN